MFRCTFEADSDVDVVESVRFHQLDKTWHFERAGCHSLRFCDIVSDGQEYDAQQQEYDDGDMKNFGLNLRLHGSVESAHCSTNRRRKGRNETE